MIDFFFDCSSPWTYLGFDSIERLAAETGVKIAWYPFLVGGVFNTINGSVYAARANGVPAKLAYAAKDLQDWCRLQGLTIRQATVFPVNSARAMRACIVADADGHLPVLARNIFEAYWRDDQDISQLPVLEVIATRSGLDPTRLFDQADRAETRAALRQNTQQLIDRGGFGSPTMFLGDDMFFGNDRIVLLREALRRAA